MTIREALEKTFDYEKKKKIMVSVSYPRQQGQLLPLAFKTKAQAYKCRGQRK